LGEDTSDAQMLKAVSNGLRAPEEEQTREPSETPSSGTSGPAKEQPASTALPGKDLP
jgi:hypothetical protein